MNKKTIAFVLLLGLFGGIHPGFAETPAGALLTAVPADEELTQLLGQVVPYKIDGEDVPPEKGRFLFELNRLISEDLKEQSDEYKRAACKLALQMALVINKTVDSIEVQRNNYYMHPQMRAEDDRIYWVLGGDMDDPPKWRISGERIGEGGIFHHPEVTVHLFTLKDKKIIHVSTLVSANACGGKFSSCCDYAADPDGLFTEVWKRSQAIIEKKKHNEKLSQEAVE